MSKELFNQILDAIDESPDNVPPFILAGIKTKDPHIRSELLKYYDHDIILTVMNSSIFHEGCLRNESPSRKTSTFKVYSVIDLTYFIMKASILIIKKDLEEIFQESISEFDTAINQIETLQFVAQFYRSPVSYNKLEKIIKQLNDIKSQLLNKPNPSKLGFRIDKFWRQQPDRIDKLIELFEEQVPDAPPFTIGRAIHKLLSQFGIPSTEAAITQRIYRKNKRK